MNRSLPIAAAVTAALAAGAAYAAGPSVAAINLIPAKNTIYISGSSAIKGALSTSIINTFCGGAGNTTVISTTGDKNWLGFACTPVSGLATNSGNYLIDFRFEGGSVTGYLPIANATAGVLQIDGPTLTATSIAVVGTTEANGQLDNFTTSAGGTLTRHPVDLGIGDVEPKAITGNNYPQDYCTTVFGPVNNNGMFSLSPTGLIVDEVYALFVNETGGTFTQNPMNLSQQVLGDILSGGIKDWSKVTDINGNAVVNASTPITVVNREYGSGSRTATDILIVGDNCSSNATNETIIAQPAKTRYFSTGDVLAAAGSVAGAITYATVENAPATNLTMVNLNGVAPTNLNAALGSYPFWVEAAYINNAATTGADSLAINNIVAGLQNEATTAALSDINAIPDVAAATGGNFNSTVHANPVNSGVVPSGGGTATVYINPFTRAANGKGSTCHTPVFSATAFP
ncbi:MAG TPA: substrate-binding domain-containing protein [Steroidobacteraceae bacterium]|nr:substrate-binding domain-containing protein [Steroidobacteraceae bacterium]